MVRKPLTFGRLVVIVLLFVGSGVGVFLLTLNHGGGVVADLAKIEECNEEGCTVEYYVQLSDGRELGVILPFDWGRMREGQYISFDTYGIDTTVGPFRFRPTIWRMSILEEPPR